MLTREGDNNQTFSQAATNSFNYFSISQLHSILILLYRENGDKCTGQWHDWEGQGEINYKDGTKYIGQWDGYGDSKRYGVGTLYSADGQVLNQGKWENDKYMGKE